MLRVAVFGAAGRMGRAVVKLIQETPDLALGAAVVSEESGFRGKDAGWVAGVREIGVDCTPGLSGESDVAIEFSTPAGLAAALAGCRQAKIPLVSGTTGLADAQHELLDEAAREIPVLWAANMSLGVQVCYRLVAEATRLLRDRADVEIIEAHHRHKRDAPSGTALEFARIAADALNVHFPDNTVRGRAGTGLTRGDGEIGVSAVRAGDIVGEHTVLYAMAGERIEVRHAAQDRSVFVRGAIAAARYLDGKPAGRYRLADLFGGSAV